MPRIERPQDAWRVDIVESERGWGRKIEESIYFDNELEAKQFTNNYNDEYNPPLKPGEGVPDWYMYADYVGKIG